MPPLEPAARPAGSVRSARLQDVIDAATAVLDADGAEALTMRRLADELGMRAPSIYKHVRDKATLEAALIEDALFDLGDALHAALAHPGPEGVVASVLHTYRARSLEVPNRYRLATSGRLRRDLLPECLEDWAGQPFYFAADRDEYRSQALWSLAHGMVILEIDGRYPDGSDLDQTWAAAAAAFGSPLRVAAAP